jgi:hypothetical protein
MHYFKICKQNCAMILQGSLRMEYDGSSYLLNVKTFLKDKVYYFYINDKELENPLLHGKTLELTFTDSFCLPATEAPAKELKVPEEIEEAVKQMLLQNKELWYY